MPLGKLVPHHVQGLVESDPQLADHADHLRHRFSLYSERRAAIEAAEGSLAAFAKVLIPSSLIVNPHFVIAHLGGPN